MTKALLPGTDLPFEASMSLRQNSAIRLSGNHRLKRLTIQKLAEITMQAKG
jgi:hypothetical protein